MITVAIRPAVSTVPEPVYSHEKVAARAYEKWCQRGCTHGHDLQDWLVAEAELQREERRRSRFVLAGAKR